MLGRGAVADPLLARRIRDGGKEHDVGADWEILECMIAELWAGVQAKLLRHHSPGRLKQWLRLMQNTYPQAATLYAEIRTLRAAEEVSLVLENRGSGLCRTQASAGLPDR
jgi:tRNA-dihydrouridine synthase C